MVIVCKKNHHAIDNLNKQKKTDSEMKFLLADILTLAKVLFLKISATNGLQQIRLSVALSNSREK